MGRKIGFLIIFGFFWKEDKKPWMDKMDVESLALEGFRMVPLYMVELTWTRGSSQTWMAVSRPPTLTIIVYETRPVRLARCPGAICRIGFLMRRDRQYMANTCIKIGEALLLVTPLSLHD